MVNKIYISAPIVTDWSTVMRFHDILKQKYTDVKVWDRGSRYFQKDFDDAGHVVFVLPNNKFKASFHELPVGVKKELHDAVTQNKKIYIAYTTKDFGNFIYDAKSDGRNIEGIGGTANKIFLKLPSDSVKKGIDAVEEMEKLLRGMASTDINISLVSNGTSIWSTNPCAEIALPNSQAECVLPVAKIVHATLVSNPDYVDERLLLMM
jgi:hypothetical protein